MKQERKQLNQRFITALDYLESKGIVTRYSHRKNVELNSVSYGDLAVIMGDGEQNLPTSRIADFRNEKRFVDYPEAIRFSEAFDIRKEWMCFGTGQMLKTDKICEIINGEHSWQVLIGSSVLRFSGVQNAEYLIDLCEEAGYTVVCKPEPA